MINLAQWLTDALIPIMACVSRTRDAGARVLYTGRMHLQPAPTVARSRPRSQREHRGSGGQEAADGGPCRGPCSPDDFCCPRPMSRTADNPGPATGADCPGQRWSGSV